MRRPPASKWHDLKVRISGNKVEGYLDGKRYLEYTLAANVPAASVLVKSSSYMHFSDYTVTPAD